MGESFNTEYSIIICKECKGRGSLEFPNLDSSLLFSKKTILKTCPNCNGSGRLVEIKKWAIMVEPFDPKKWADKNIRFNLNET